MKKSEKALRKRIKEIISVVLSFTLVTCAVTVPVNVNAADGQVYELSDDLTLIDTDWLMPGDTVKCPLAAKLGFLYSLPSGRPGLDVSQYEYETFEAAWGSTSDGKKQVVGGIPATWFFTRSFTVPVKPDNGDKNYYIYRVETSSDYTLTDDGMGDDVSTVVAVFLDAYPAFQAVYHDGDGNAISGTQYFYPEKDEDNSVFIAQVGGDFTVDVSDSDLGDLIGWSNVSDYFDYSENLNDVFVSGEDIIYIESTDLYDKCENKAQNGILNLYPVFNLYPSTLSVSADDYKEGEELSLTVDTNRKDDYQLSYEKKNSDGTFATLTAAPTTAGNYRVTVSYPQTETMQGEGELGMEIRQRGYTAISESVEFTILANALLKTKPAANSLTYNGDNQALVSAGSAEGGSVLYSLAKDGEYTEDVPVGKSADSYTVWYMVNGSEGYSDISPESIEVKILPKTVGIEWSEETDFTYDGEDHCLSAEATGLYDGDTCDVTVNGAAKEVGSHTAKAAGLSNSDYALPEDTEKSFTISAADSSVKTAPAGKELIYDGTEQALINAGEALGGIMVYSLSENGTYSEEIPTGKNAKEYTVWYMISGDSNHNSSSKYSVTATISPKEIGIEWSETEYTYDENEHCPTAAATGLCDGDTCTLTVTGGGTDVGTYTAAVTGKSNDNYMLPETVNTSFTISAAEASVKNAPTATDLTYDGNNQALVDSGEALGGTMVYSLSEDGTYTTEIPMGKNSGEYTVWYMVLGDSNHKSSSKYSVKTTVSPKTIGVEWSEESEYIYDGEEHCPSAVITGLCEGDTCEATVTGAAAEIGTYTARISGISNANYALPYEITKDFKIVEEAPKNPVITGNPKGKELTYNGNSQNLIAAGTAVAGEMLYSISESGEYTANIPTGKDAGEYTIWYMVKGEEGYNDIAPQKINTTISSKEVGLEWSDTTFKYDGAEHCPSVKVTGISDGDSCSVTVTGAAKEIGVHTAIAASVSNPNYKLPGNNTKEFSIYDPSKKTGSVTVSMNGFIYGGKASSPAITSKTNDASKAAVVYKPAGDSDLAYSTAVPTEVGNYTIKVTLPENDEYNACTATAGFSITYLTVPENAFFIRGTKGNDDWYTSQVEISPGQGYQISLGDRNHFTNNPVRLSNNIDQVLVYVRDTSTYEQTDAIKVGNFKIDSQAPEVEDMDSDEVYFADEDGKVTCIVSDDNLSYVVIGDNKVELTNLGNGRKSFTVPVGAKKETVSFTAYDLAGNKTDFSLTTAPSWKRDGVISEGEIYLEAGEKFTIPEGKWTVDGDETVYYGGTVFYASKEGMYTFKKK